MNTATDAIYHAVFEASRDAVLLIEDEHVVECNAAAVEMFEAISKETLLGSRPSDFSPRTQPTGETSADLCRERLHEAKEQGTAMFEWVHRTLRGRTFISEVVLSRVDTDEATLVQGVIRDVSGRRRIEDNLRRTNQQLEHFRTLVEDAIDQSGIGLFILDAEFRIVWVSQPIRQFMGIDPADALGVDKRSLIEHTIQHLFENGDRYVRNIDAAYNENTSLEGRTYHVIPTRTLEERWLEHQSYPIMSGMYAGGRIDIYRDVTDRARLEDELSHRATHDYLTGLLNRQQFEVLLDQEMYRAQRYGAPLCLGMFDIDQFKSINDTLGHEAGDRVLKRLAAEPRKCIRSTDRLARWGGEEFMLLLPDCSLDNATRTMEALRARIDEMKIDEDTAHLTISVGVTQYVKGETRRNLLKRLDDALYSAKKRGRNRVVAENGK